MFKNDKDVQKVNLSDLYIEHLKYIDVVVSNNLPYKWQIILNGLRIVSITIDEIDIEDTMTDIFIDFQYKGYDRFFIGENHSICNNLDQGFYYRGIFDLITYLEWDSQFFGFPVAYLSSRHLTENILYRTNSFIKNNKIRLVEYLCNCHDKRSVLLAEDNNFRFKDIRLTYGKSLVETEEVNLDGCIKFGLAKKRHIPSLKKITKNIYLHSRYYFDDNFNKEKISEFYMGWVEKAVLGQYDDECYILLNAQDPIAYCTIKYEGAKHVQIGLVGVAENYTGKGLGKKILQAVFNTLCEKGVKTLSVVTQGRNYHAQRLYQKVGFLTKSTELWYHKWL